MTNVRSIIGLLLLITTLQATAQHQVRFVISKLPETHPRNSAIFIAGSFNGWNPGDTAWRFSQTKNGYELHARLKTGMHEYKLTRGDWSTGESRRNGAHLANRLLKLDSDTTITIEVAGWADHFDPPPSVSTKGKNVHIIDTAFYMPQLDRSRRVWVCLPESYNDTDKKYAVLYMHDGQNLFDSKGSYSGEWGIDEAMDSLELLTGECIIVAVDHGGMRRLNEYNPYDHEEYGKGEGDAYSDFVALTLKPWIDAHYRTKKGRNCNFIAGSSMGGLISLYTLLKHPDVFGAAGVFSPAFWIGPGIYMEMAKKKKLNARIYLYAGKEEWDHLVPDVLRAFNILHGKKNTEVKLVIREEGRHTETDWRREFPGFYRWLRE